MRGAHGAPGAQRCDPLGPLFLSGLCFVCGRRTGGHAEGRGWAPAPASRVPFKVRGQAPPRELPGRQVGPRAAELARQQAAPASGPGGAGPAAPRPPRPPLPPARAHTLTSSGRFHVFLGEVRSSERARAGRAAGAALEPEAGPISPLPTEPSRPPQASEPPKAGPGSAPICAAGGVSLLLKDESRHGCLCRFSRTVAASAAASLHIQVENFQESAETLCPKKTESQLPPNPGGDSPWKTSLR